MLGRKHQSQVGEVTLEDGGRKAGSSQSTSATQTPWAAGGTVSKQIQEPTTTNPNIVQTEKLKYLAL